MNRILGILYHLFGIFAIILAITPLQKIYEVDGVTGGMFFILFVVVSYLCTEEGVLGC